MCVKLPSASSSKKAPSSLVRTTQLACGSRVLRAVSYTHLLLAGGQSLVADGAEEVTIIDTVSYQGLTPGEEYELSAVLMDKEENAPWLVEGKVCLLYTSIRRSPRCG